MTLTKELARLGKHFFSPRQSFQDDLEHARLNGCYHGSWGTSDFYIDGDHDMYIGTGALRGRLYDVIGAERARSLDTITFVGPVRAPRDSSRLLSGTDEIYTSERPMLRLIYGLDRMDTSQVVDMHGMFANDIHLRSLDLSQWHVGQVRDFSSMFHNLSSLEYLNVADWDTSHATDMHGTFNGLDHLQSLDIRRWRTSQVRDMSWMFTDTTSLYRLDLSHLDMAKVQDMNAMFLWMSPSTAIKLNHTVPWYRPSGIQDKNTAYVK